MFQDFKKFVMRGNVFDMAVGIIIGTAFGKIISSFVSDVLMPPIGLLMGKVDFTNLFINLSGQPIESLVAATEAGLPIIKYGLFINTVIDFVIIAFVIFMLVRQMEKMIPKPVPAPAVELKECPFCLSQIPAKASRCPNCTSILS